MTPPTALRSLSDEALWDPTPQRRKVEHLYSEDCWIFDERQLGKRCVVSATTSERMPIERAKAAVRREAKLRRKQQTRCRAMAARHKHYDGWVAAVGMDVQVERQAECEEAEWAREGAAWARVDAEYHMCHGRVESAVEALSGVIRLDPDGSITKDVVLPALRRMSCYYGRFFYDIRSLVLHAAECRRQEVLAVLRRAVRRLCLVLRVVGFGQPGGDSIRERAARKAEARSHAAFERGLTLAECGDNYAVAAVVAKQADELAETKAALLHARMEVSRLTNQVSRLTNRLARPWDDYSDYDDDY